MQGFEGAVEMSVQLPPLKAPSQSPPPSPYSVLDSLALAGQGARKFKELSPVISPPSAGFLLPEI
jgi:hypothetical protein